MLGTLVNGQRDTMWCHCRMKQEGFLPTGSQLWSKHIWILPFQQEIPFEITYHECLLSSYDKREPDNFRHQP